MQEPASRRRGSLSKRPRGLAGPIYRGTRSRHTSLALLCILPGNRIPGDNVNASDQKITA